MIQVALCTIGITFIAGPHPRCQQQFPPLLHHHEGATTTGNFIRLAKSIMGVTARGGATEHTARTIITWCHGIISTAGQPLHYHLPRSPRIPHHSRPSPNNHKHPRKSLDVIYLRNCEFSWTRTFTVILYF